MAATKKALEVQAKKQEAAQLVRELQKKVKDACNRVPQSVMDGDAVANATWRTKAEEIYFKACASMERGADLAKSYSLKKLNEIAKTWSDALREVEA